jgi:hypothetical protein
MKLTMNINERAIGNLFTIALGNFYREQEERFEIIEGIPEQFHDRDAGQFSGTDRFST